MSWLFSRVLVEEYSEGISLDGELFAPSSGNHTQPVFSSADKTTVFSRRSLSGMTFKLLTEDHGEAVLMSFLEAFPAKTFQSPAKELESTASEAVCGDTWRESSARYCPDSSSWKTHRCLWEEDLQESSVILPRWGMMLNGVLWERITLPLLTSGTESGSLLPTPTCAAAVQGVNQPDGKRGQTLLGAAKGQTWATPTTMDSLPPKSEKALMKEATEARPGRSKPANLRDQVSNGHLWPTPCASDADKWNAKTLEERVESNQQVRLGNALSTDGVRVGGTLNPMWVEWLMGWPLGWTDLRPLETDRFQEWLNAHGESSQKGAA